MGSTKKITIQDIAAKANVSKSTVSRVLTGNTNVADDKQNAVLAAMKELDYQPNIFARGLAGGQSFTIGVLTQNFGSPFYDAILRGIVHGLNRSDYSPIFADGRWRAGAEQAALDTLMGRRVDGLIVVGGLSAGRTLAEIGAQVPLLVVARQVPELDDRCLFVDNYQAAYEATGYLIQAGHRQIAHIAGDQSHQDAVQRQAGYLQALVDAGLEPNPQLIVQGDLMSPSGVMAVEMLLTRGQPFSALFVANDQMAIGARLALFRHGLRVPDDVSLVGFDDLADAAFMIPPLTTVRQPALEMGEAASQAMLQLLKGASIDLPPFTTTLVMRESVARR